MSVGAFKRHGFTLVEILVVLAIMVILFGLLFAPMMTSIDMATTGRNRARMQEAVRYSLEQAKRDIANALIVYPPESVRLPGADGAFGTPDDTFIMDYATLTLGLPARTASGEVAQPLRQLVEPAGPGPDGVIGTADDIWLPRVVRYAIHTPDTVQRVLPASAPANLERIEKYYVVPTKPDIRNSFVLYRQEGWLRENRAAGIYEFGSYAVPVDGGAPRFIIGRPDVENALTSHEGMDMPVTTSVSLNSGAMAAGYVDVALNVRSDPRDDTLAKVPTTGGWSASDIHLVYIHDGVSFTPLRIAGEWLTASADGVLYRAKYGNWMGYQNDGSRTLADVVSAGLLNGTELAPHFRLMRFFDPANPTNPPYTSNVVVDSKFGPVPDDPVIHWNSAAGAVRIGQSFSATVTFADPGAHAIPGRYYAFQITDSEGGNVTYRSDGSRTVSSPSILAPIYPDLPLTILDPAAPIAFAIDPAAAGGAPAKLVLNSLRVWVDATYAGTGMRQRLELAPASTTDATAIGPFAPFKSAPGAIWWDPAGQPTVTAQFAPYLTESHGLRGEVRFNIWRPPSPQAWAPGRLAGYPDGLKLHIVGTMRRNFDPVTFADDRLAVGYSTTRELKIALKVSRFEPLTDAGGSNVLRPEKDGGSVAVHDQVRPGNLGR